MIVCGAIRGAWTALTTLDKLFKVQIMKVQDILDDLDRSIETRVLQVLEGHMQQEYREQIRQAIKQGQEDFWSEYLPIILRNDADAKRAREKFFATDI
jgi:hypothetical protein